MRKERNEDDNWLKLGQCCAIDFLAKMNKSFYHFLLYSKFIFLHPLIVLVSLPSILMYYEIVLAHWLSYLILSQLKIFANKFNFEKRNFETVNICIAIEKRINRGSICKLTIKVKLILTYLIYVRSCKAS